MYDSIRGCFISFDSTRAQPSLEKKIESRVWSCSEHSIYLETESRFFIGKHSEYRVHPFLKCFLQTLFGLENFRWQVLRTGLVDAAQDRAHTCDAQDPGLPHPLLRKYSKGQGDGSASKYTCCQA